ncbi:hypothetical protein BDN70DRAFT_528655 [Pholiota conissans]|uniref:F-box domain-containing protein n=1 Tax=Pholiota conissans TaxID=109636 RepID=A0A9P5Z7K2_9AGAR|nr:hypothetical protein BDN70DRAFT_528655 [Pholiota conissans]
MSQGSDLFSGTASNPPSPPPPKYDAMINKMAGTAFNLSAPDDQPHSFSKPTYAKPTTDPIWSTLPINVSTPPDVLALPSSKFDDKLNTNYIPSMTEITEIKEYVSSVNDKVSDYDVRIAELQAALQAITEQRTRLHETVSAHEALVSPLRRLPPEILQIIFVWCLSQNRNAVMHASEAPVLLGRICSEWRRISLATPELWASLHIVPPNVNFSNPASSTARFERKRDLVSMWLDRSGACPLSISLVWFAGDSEEEIKLCGTLLEILVPLRRRWKHLDFQVPLKMFKPFVGLTVDEVPYLESMSLMDNRTPLDADAVDRWPESLTFAEGATRLKNFTLTFFSGGIRLPIIPWHQLTVLYLESNIAFFFRDAREMLTTLGLCTSLISCTLKFPLSHTASLPAYDALDLPITLPQLQVLCLDGDQHLHNTFHMSNTLVNICAPRLRKLEILGRSGRPEGSVAPEPLCAIKRLLQRSKCPLEKLNVESMTMVPDEFVACLRLVPTLVDLIVHNWSVRVTVGTTPTGEDVIDANEVAENQILKALTLSKPGQESENVKETPGTEESGSQSLAIETFESSASNNADSQSSIPVSVQTIIIEPPSPTISMKHECQSEEVIIINSPASRPLPSPSSSSSAQPSDTDTSPLCPNLERFDFTLCDASQNLLCDFVSSRWKDLPEGVRRIKTVKCNFTAFEDEAVKARLQVLRTEGLDAFVTYQVPINDDLNPSPWTGLEGPP